MKKYQITASVKKYLKVWTAPLKDTFNESRGVQILCAVLVMQLAVAAALLWRSSSQADFSPVVQLVSVDPSTVEHAIIDDGDERVTLVKVDGQWRIENDDKTLASADKIEQLISKIADLKPGLPVASTAGSHKQLGVSESDFQRRVTLKSGDEAVVDLLMGTSPGFRKSHIRRIDQEQVYAARLNTFDVPGGQDDWLDKTLLAFGDINRIESEAIELSLVDEQWIIVKPQEQAETHEVDSTGVTALVNRVKSLRVDGFATPLEPDEFSNETSTSDDSKQVEAEALLKHSITVVQGDTPVTLTLSRKGGDATIERSDVEGLFALPVSMYDELTEEVIQKILVEKSADTSEDSSQPQG